MRTIRELFNSYATPATEEELRLIAKLNETPPVSAMPGRGDGAAAKPTPGD